MAKRMFSAFLGEGPRAAARQYAGLIALAAALALLGAANQPDRAVELLAIAAADESLAILAWAMPWDRWHRNFPALLALPALAVLAFSTWAFGGFAAGTGPFFVLVFAWLGLHFGPWVIAALTPPAVAAHHGADRPRDVAGERREPAGRPEADADLGGAAPDVTDPPPGHQPARRRTRRTPGRSAARAALGAASRRGGRGRHPPQHRRSGQRRTARTPGLRRHRPVGADPHQPLQQLATARQGPDQRRGGTRGARRTDRDPGPRPRGAGAC